MPIAPRLSSMICGLIFFATGLHAEPYVWQQAQAKRLPGGMLKWSPKPYVFKAGESQRYIDFEGGNDAADGKTMATAWKHHPWDANAAGKAKVAATEVHTYVFKGGVIYRGHLEAQASGTEANPIRLNRDPKWGKGQAAIHGSVRITKRWNKVTDAPEGMPSPSKVWVVNVGDLPEITGLWEMHGEKVVRVPIARSPNWTLGNPDDVKAEWARWETTWPGYGKPQFYPDKPQVKKDRTWGVNRKLLNAKDANAYDGMTVWTEFTGLMGNPYPSPMLAYDPAKNAVQITPPWSGKRRPTDGDRFYLENHPRFLDSAGEYWHDTKAGKLYMRTTDDSDPNRKHIEVAHLNRLITIAGQKHIHIEGLHFRFQRVPELYVRFWGISEIDPTTIHIGGTYENIRIANNVFEQVQVGVRAGTKADSSATNLVISDNQFQFCDQGAIGVSNGDLVHILRNKLYEVGGRPQRPAKGVAINVNRADRQIIAGNICERMYAQGINVWGGKTTAVSWGKKKTVPEQLEESVSDDLTRILIFDNQVVDGMLTSNDYGNIETWQGGPTYVFNNVSTRPHGYWQSMDAFTNKNYKEKAQEFMKRYPPAEWPQVSQAMAVARVYGGSKRGASTASFAYAYYSDGGFKQYFFNNIAQGRSSDVNSSLSSTGAYHGVGGAFMLGLFNNTFHRFAKGITRHGSFSSTDYWVGNMMEDIGYTFLSLGPANTKWKPMAPDADPERDALQNVSNTLLQAIENNVFSGTAQYFGAVAGTGAQKDLNALSDALTRSGAISAGIGKQVKKPILRNPDKGDFRPADSAYNNTQRVFLPWALSRTVGEWQFRRMKYEPQRVVGEHWYMSREYLNRGMYRYLPRHDLTGKNITAENYVSSPHESWIDSAMTLNGKDQSLSLKDASLKSDAKWPIKKGQGEEKAPASLRETPDMGVNDFLIETVVSVKQGATGGLAGKAGSNGYQLRVDAKGSPVLELWNNGKAIYTATAQASITNGAWHHLIVEVERAKGITFHLNGKTVRAKASGNMPAPTVSLSNTADFLVGTDKQGSHLAMTIDFLRVCKEDLDGARTTAKELHAWQFQGPQHKTWWGSDVARAK